MLSALRSGDLPVGNWALRAACGGNAALLPAGSLGAKVVVARRG